MCQVLLCCAWVTVAYEDLFEMLPHDLKEINFQVYFQVYFFCGEIGQKKIKQQDVQIFVGLKLNKCEQLSFT